MTTAPAMTTRPPVCCRMAAALDRRQQGLGPLAVAGWVARRTVTPWRGRAASYRVKTRGFRWSKLDGCGCLTHRGLQEAVCCCVHALCIVAVSECRCFSSAWVQVFQPPCLVCVVCKGCVGLLHPVTVTHTTSTRAVRLSGILGVSPSIKHQLPLVFFFSAASSSLRRAHAVFSSYKRHLSTSYGCASRLLS